MNICCCLASFKKLRNWEYEIYFVFLQGAENGTRTALSTFSQRLFVSEKKLNYIYSYFQDAASFSQSCRGIHCGNRISWKKKKTIKSSFMN